MRHPPGPANTRQEVIAILPSEVVRLLHGAAAEDAWEPIFLLLTTSQNGYAQVCQLSRAEIETGDDVVRVIVRARRTIVNLNRDGQALLVVVGGQSAHYLKLRLTMTLAEDDGRTLAVSFAVDDVEEDTLGISLRPMMFHASSSLRRRERWDENHALLGRLTQALLGPDSLSGTPAALTRRPEVCLNWWARQGSNL
jgi:hypothetical protein